MTWVAVAGGGLFKFIGGVYASHDCGSVWLEGKLCGKVWESEGERKENEKKSFLPTLWVLLLATWRNFVNGE